MSRTRDPVLATLGPMVHWGRQVTKIAGVDSDGSLRRGLLSEIRMARRIKLCGNPGWWSRQRAQPLQRHWGRMVPGMLEEQWGGNH